MLKREKLIKQQAILRDVLGYLPDYEEMKAIQKAWSFFYDCPRFYQHTAVADAVREYLRMWNRTIRGEVAS
jgi:hypothetical protein